MTIAFRGIGHARIRCLDLKKGNLPAIGRSSRNPLSVDRKTRRSVPAVSQAHLEERRQARRDHAYIRRAIMNNSAVKICGMACWPYLRLRSRWHGQRPSRGFLEDLSQKYDAPLVVENGAHSRGLEGGAPSMGPAVSRIVLQLHLQSREKEQLGNPLAYFDGRSTARALGGIPVDDPNHTSFPPPNDLPILLRQRRNCFGPRTETVYLNRRAKNHKRLKFCSAVSSVSFTPPASYLTPRNEHQKKLLRDVYHGW